MENRPDPDECEKPRVLSAIPTGFTSREAKLWEAKSKATERNWRNRKEDELICKVCGEKGHFTQGCPSTLGANRKSQDFLERVSAREIHVRAFFTEKVIHEIEKDIGCKIKVEEKCIVICGKDRVILSKGANAVRKVKEEAERRHYDSLMRRSISPEKSSVGPHCERSDSQGSHPSPSNTSQFQQGFGRHDKVVEDLVREDFREMERSSSQVRGEAFAYDGSRGCSSRLKSPTQRGSLYDGHRYSQNMEHYKTNGWDAKRQGCDKYCGRDSATPHMLEELELEHKREAMDLERIREKQEEEEKKKHQHVAREMREKYIEKQAELRGIHAKQRQEFLQQQQKLHVVVEKRIPPTHHDGLSSSSSSSVHGGGGGGGGGCRRQPSSCGGVPMVGRTRSAVDPNFSFERPGKRRSIGDDDDYGKASDRY